MPTFDQKVKNKAQAQSDFQLQQAVMNAPKEADPNAVIAQAGAQNAVQNAGQAAQQQQTSLNNQLQDNQNQLQQEGFKNQMQLKKGQQQLSQERDELTNRVQQMDSEFKDKYLDAQMNFREYKNKRTIDTQEQMMDYMVARQATEAEWAKYAQGMKQGQQEKQMAYDYAHQVLTTTLQQSEADLIQKYGQDSVKRMRWAKEEARKKAEREQSKGSLSGMLLGGTMAIAGGIMCAFPATAAFGAPLLTSGISMTASSYSSTGEYK